MNFFHTHISARARQMVDEVLASGRLSEGPLVQQFENELASRLGLAHPVALNSGTSALHLSLVLAGVGPEDEVILPAQTFVATGLAVLMQRAVPVFADIDTHTGNLCPQSVARRFTRRTKAVIPVHWGGLPCDLAPLNELAARHDAVVIEDAAHALGANYRGQAIGSVSRFTCFSFQAIKHLTTGDGGALCCTSEVDARRAKTQRWFGIDRQQSRPSLLGERIYDIDSLGFKYHMNDLSAALGLGNLDDFTARLARRREIAGRYREALADVPGIQLLADSPDREHAYWLFTLLVDRREDLIRHLADAGIPSSVVHQRIDRNRIFGGMRADLPGQAEFDRRQLAIPVHEALTDSEVQQIIDVIHSRW
ncbi:MAG TPA: DegT/DnrJ/EryC1/StrS family aminotransferase [Pirellulales bacterium]|jgi:perosamine synthetase|nr:DegT/DnrJ/EryC1/StrS family aminotransferase [Pirellulales bacterium]